MDSQRYARAKPIFAQALELPPEERAPFVREQVGADDGLACEILALLANVGAGESLFRAVLVDAGRRDPALDGASPARIGPYRIVEPIGLGGAGVVYRARQSGLDRDVAVKLLRADVADAAARERFEREARLLGRLRHPGIAEIYEVGVLTDSFGSRPWFALEFVPGQNLDAYARARGTSLRSLVECLERIAAAMGAAHAQGIVHCDLKPSNVRVREDGVVKVLDFGVARCAQQVDVALTTSGRLLGTLRYMSPEQAQGIESKLDARSDVYSLGVVAYESIAGTSPHGSDDLLAHELLRSIRDVDPVPLWRLRADVPRDLAAIVATAMAKDPARRYPDARALALDLARHLRGEPVLARPPGSWERAVRLVRRQRVFFGAVAATLAALGAGWFMTWRAYAEYFEVQDGRDHLAYGRTLDSLEARERELFPAEPERLPDFELWLADSERFRRETRPVLEGADLSADPRNARVRDTREVQTNLALRIARFVGPGGSIEQVRARAERARTLSERTVTGFRADWEDAVRRIRASEVYGGLAIQPQVGLIPLGPDPISGLEEFALLDVTGSMPTREASTGELLCADDATIVFVLLPGGSFPMGAQNGDRDGSNYWKYGHAGTQPVHGVAVEPFLMSKFELTRAQWLAVESADPSYGPVGSVHAGGPITLRTPVDSMDWFQATAYARRLGLELPSEEQWEYAARAGTTTTWWPGQDETSLPGTGNYRDASYDEMGPRPPQDIYELSAPVGLFRPNGWGLYDVYGNVGEFCRDIHRDSGYEPGEATGETGWRVTRGGSCGDLIPACNSANRARRRPHAADSGAGLRPIRTLRGPWSRPGG